MQHAPELITSLDSLQSEGKSEQILSPKPLRSYHKKVKQRLELIICLNL